VLNLSGMAKHKRHRDHWRRSLVKTITYRIIIVITIYAISLFITDSARQALAITGWNAILATIIYYAHERIWSRIRWGKN
jgi:uncharacterized membrane protein